MGKAQDVQLPHRSGQLAAETATTTTFYEGGDLTLLLDQNEQGLYEHKFIVLSHTLIMMSPVWKAMLSGKFREGSTMHEIPLPDDDPEAMKFILNIVHLRPSSAPKSFVDNNNRFSEVEIALLSEITILCDKYDCATLCKNSGRWKSKLQRTLRSNQYKWRPRLWPEYLWQPGAPMLCLAIFFAYVFGYEDSMVSWIRDLHYTAVLGSKLCDNGEDPLEGQYPNLDLLPQGIQGELLQ